MASRREKRDMSVDEFNAWYEAERKVDAARADCQEEGGPSVSLVPNPTSCPLDFLPDEVTVPAEDAGESHIIPFKPEPSRKTGGWSAERQRQFIQALAETGSVHLASRHAGLSARSAYGLRVRSPAFARAWDTAQQLAVGRLSALAFDRAIHGRVEQIYSDGQLIAERRLPSDRLTMWLLSRLDPKRFAYPWERAKNDAVDPQAEAQQSFSTVLAALTDTPEDGDLPE